MIVQFFFLVYKCSIISKSLNYRYAGIMGELLRMCYIDEN